MPDLARTIPASTIRRKLDALAKRLNEEPGFGGAIQAAGVLKARAELLGED